MAFIDNLEAEASEQLDVVRAARVYQGSNPDYKAKAKIAIGIIGAYVRLRATIANERSNALIEQRLLRELPDTPKRLPARRALTDGGAGQSSREIEG